MKIKPTSEKAKSASKVSSRSHLGERVPRLRFPGFEGEWEEQCLETFMYSRDERQIPSPDAPLMAFIAKLGVAPKGERYDREYLVKSKDKEYKRTEFNDFIYSSNNLDVGSIGLNKYGRAVISDVYEIFTMKDGYAPEFISELVQRPRNLHKVLRFRQGCLYGQYRIYASDFLSVKLLAPDNEEQFKIAGFLQQIDTRITAQRRLVELLKKHKRGLHSAIFGQKCRVVNADGKPWPAWRQARIGDIFQERSERGGTADELLSVTINNGVKRQADTDKKDSSSEDKSNYKKVLPGDIVYNTMRMWQGASGVSPWAGIVSPAYTVIYPRGRQNTTFWAYAFKYWRLIQEFQKFSQGLTSDTWNLKYPQLSDIRVYEPSMDEQEAIVDILSMLDERVSAAEQELNKMRNLKSGLLQQLFV